MSDHKEPYRLDRRHQGGHQAEPPPSYGRLDAGLPRFRVGQAVRIGDRRGLPGTVVHLGERTVTVEWECGGQVVRGVFEFFQVVAD